MLYYVCQFNPFTHAVELVRFALYGQINWVSLAVVGGCTAVFMIGAIYAYDPSRGLASRGRRRRNMNWRLMITALLAVAAPTGRALPPIPAIRTGRALRRRCRRSRLPRCGRSAARRHQGQMEGRRQGQPLVTKLAARRTPLDEAEKTIAEFLSSAAAAEKTATGKLLFAGLFDTLNAQRASVMVGSNA